MLEESGDASRMLDAHASYFLDMAERAEPELKGPRQAEVLQQLLQPQITLTKPNAMAVSLLSKEGEHRFHRKGEIFLYAGGNYYSQVTGSLNFLNFVVEGG